MRPYACIMLCTAPSCHDVSEVTMHHALQKEHNMLSCTEAVTPKYHRYAQTEENIRISRHHCVEDTLVEPTGMQQKNSVASCILV